MMDETILLVDDEEGIRRVLGITLEDMGYEVLTAKDGDQALKIFEEKRPSLVLTDIKMPGMGGIELLKAVKDLEPETEVIMITGHGDMELAIKSLKFEAADFITKPINDDVLELALKRVREKIGMRRQLKEYTENLEKMVEEKSARLVEVERLAAVGQVVEGFSSALKNIAGDLAGGIKYFNEMPALVSIHDSRLSVVAANQLYRDRFGDRIGEESWGIYSGDARKMGACPVGATFDGGRGRRSKETVRFTDGTETPVIVHTAPIRNSAGEIELVIEIAADISEINRIKEELRKTQAMYHQLFDAVPSYITVVDRDFRLTAANSKFKEEFGGQAGAFCYQLYKHRQEPCRNCPVAETFETGQTARTEMVVSSKDGRREYVWAVTAPIFNAEGEITEVMEVSTNITQIRELQDHLSSLGLLIGSISHGVKGLLTALDGGMYRLSSGFAKENKELITEGYETVKLMVGRIRAMILDILYYAKERDLQWEKVDVLSLAREIADVAEARFSSHDVALKRDFEAETGEFEVDPGVVSSALINILDNALDACLLDRDNEEPRVIFRVRKHEQDIVFEIIDNGVGMDRETRDKLFTLFFSSKGTRGTGLGLYVSNQIIKQHGGRIQVDSEEGRGSSFKIHLPVVMPAEVKKKGRPDKNVLG